MSPCHAWAEVLTQQSPLALRCGPQSRPGALLARCPGVPGCTPCPNLRRFPGCEAGAGSLRTCPISYIFVLNCPGTSIPQIPPDEPIDPARQPMAVKPLHLHQDHVEPRSELKPTTSPLPCPAADAPQRPRQPPTLPNTSPLRGEGSREIRSPKGRQCKTQICRSWFLAQVQTTFVPEICFRALFSKRACAEACAKQRRFPPQPRAEVARANTGPSRGPGCPR